MSGDRSAVDLNERTITSNAFRVQQTREQTLPGACFTLDEHGGDTTTVRVGAQELVNLGFYRFDRAALAKKFGQCRHRLAPDTGRRNVEVATAGVRCSRSTARRESRPSRRGFEVPNARRGPPPSHVSTMFSFVNMDVKRYEEQSWHPAKPST